MEYLIRKITNNDIEEITKLYIEMYKEQKEMGMVYNFNVEHLENLLIAKIKSRYNINLLIEHDRSVIGMVLGSLVKIPNKYTLNNEKYIGFIEDLFIIKEFRNKDLGKKLFNTIEEDFKEIGIKYIELDVLEQNEIGKRFWESLGFNSVVKRMYKSI